MFVPCSATFRRASEGQEDAQKTDRALASSPRSESSRSSWAKIPESDVQGRRDDSWSFYGTRGLLASTPAAMRDTSLADADCSTRPRKFGSRAAVDSLRGGTVLDIEAAPTERRQVRELAAASSSERGTATSPTWHARRLARPACPRSSRSLRCPRAGLVSRTQRLAQAADVIPTPRRELPAVRFPSAPATAPPRDGATVHTIARGGVTAASPGSAVRPRGSPGNRAASFLGTKARRRPPLPPPPCPIKVAAEHEWAVAPANWLVDARRRRHLRPSPPRRRRDARGLLRIRCPTRCVGLPGITPTHETTDPAPASSGPGCRSSPTCTIESVARQLRPADEPCDGERPPGACAERRQASATR